MSKKGKGVRTRNEISILVPHPVSKNNTKIPHLTVRDFFKAFLHQRYEIPAFAGMTETLVGMIERLDQTRTRCRDLEVIIEVLI
jgi:hypothetical protein